MLTEEQEEIIGAALLPLFEYLEKCVIADVAARIKATMSYSRTAEIEAQSLQRLGFSPARIRKEAMKILNADPEYRKAVAKNTLEHKKTVKKLLQEILKEAQKCGAEVVKSAADLSYFDDLRTWKQAGKELTDKSFMPQLVEAIRKQTNEAMANLTKTTGFKTMSGYEPIENLYRRELDKAMIKVCTGTFSQEQIVYDTVHSLAQSGLRTIDFVSGYSMQLDTAVRLAMRTGAAQLAAKVTDGNIKQTGENLVYVSKHWGARNTEAGHANHEQWQGKVYFIKEGQDYQEEAKRIGQDYISDLWRATGYSADGSRENDPLGLHGYNCRHKHYAWFLGTSTLPKEDLQPGPVSIDGKEYDYYAVTQKMRRMEREIRALKREKEAQAALQMDTKEINAKIRQKIKDYKDFCDKAGIKADINRLRYECGTADLKKTKAWNGFEVSVASAKEIVAEVPQCGTMDVSEDKGNIEVHSIGKIDIDIYKCITEDIRTEEVIITDNQIQHIKDRHPEAYDKVLSNIQETIKVPDYIIKDKHEHTGLVVKRIATENGILQVVLRLCTSGDEQEYKNSVISCWEISERRLQNYLRNKEILYSRE